MLGKRISNRPKSHPAHLARQIKVAKIMTVLSIVIGAMIFLVRVYAEQSGGSPESGVTSYTKSLYTALQTAGYGTDTNTPDWGTYWNRISTAAQWVPSGTAAVTDAKSSKTFYGSSRTQSTGTFSPSSSTATPSDVVTGKTFVGSTGSQQTGTYTPPVYGLCSTQAYHDNYGAPVTQTTNCTVDITWTTPSPAVTGDDKKDPVSTLVWSKNLKNNSGTVVFDTNGTSTWTWDASGTNNVAVGNKTASQLCSERGNGWRLPTQKEAMQAYIDGAYFNLIFANYLSWSATQHNASDAWYVSLLSGDTYSVAKSSNMNIKCVR